jgi:exosortase/archaeosortase
MNKTTTAYFVYLLPFVNTDALEDLRIVEIRDHLKWIHDNIAYR